jgi:pimeloyl-ACP methyl ester carboxylesterase
VEFGVRSALFGVLMALALAGSAAAQPAPQPQARVQIYLIRGFMNVFSLGMDSFADALRARGLPATVANHLYWADLADEAERRYRGGQTTIILIGHSLGAAAVVSMGERLGERNVPVALGLTLDSIAPVEAAGRFDRLVNIYAAGLGSPVSRGRAFSGQLVNLDVAGEPDVNHFTIDKVPAVQRRMMALVDETIARGAARPAPVPPQRPVRRPAPEGRS